MTVVVTAVTCVDVLVVDVCVGNDEDACAEVPGGELSLDLLDVD